MNTDDPFLTFAIGLAIGLVFFFILWVRTKLHPHGETTDLRLRHAKELSDLQLRFQAEIGKIQLQQQAEIDNARAQSVNQSRSTLNGQMAEKMAPLLPGFDYDPADSKFIGDPIDYVVFNGLANARYLGGDKGDMEIVLIDVKYGKSELNKYQRSIAMAIEDGRVRFEVVRIDENHVVTKSKYIPRRRKA